MHFEHEYSFNGNLSYVHKGSNTSRNKNPCFADRQYLTFLSWIISMSMSQFSIKMQYVYKCTYVHCILVDN